MRASAAVSALWLGCSFVGCFLVTQTDDLVEGTAQSAASTGGGGMPEGGVTEGGGGGMGGEGGTAGGGGDGGAGGAGVCAVEQPLTNRPCSDCLCASCPAQTSTCLETQGCRQILVCVEEEGCTDGPSCYQPNTCKAVVDANGGSDGAAAAAAIALGMCGAMQCMADCNFGGG